MKRYLEVQSISHRAQVYDDHNHLMLNVSKSGSSLFIGRGMGISIIKQSNKETFLFEDQLYPVGRICMYMLNFIQTNQAFMVYTWFCDI